jgi:hypothetical protein
MTKQQKILANRVPELSFIEKDYKFSISANMITLGQKKRISGILTRDYVKIGEKTLRLDMQHLYAIETCYEDGKAYMIEAKFAGDYFRYELIRYRDCLQVSAVKKTKIIYFHYFALIEKAELGTGVA